MQVEQGLLQAAVAQVSCALIARGTWMMASRWHHAGLKECAVRSQGASWLGLAGPSPQ